MRTAVVFLIVIIAAGGASAQYDYGFQFSKAGTAGLQSLKITVGARDAALAGASTSLTNDVTSMFVNPGGLAFVDRPQLFASRTRWLAGSRLDAAAVGMPLGSFVVAAHVLRFGIEEFEETTVQQPEGTGRAVNAGDVTVGLAAARRFTDRLTIGLQLRYIRETLDDESFGNILFDVGAVYYTGFHNLRLAFALQHFGPDMTVAEVKFRTPLLFRVSAGEDFLLLDDHRLTSAIDLVHPTDNLEQVNLGIEYEFLKVLSLRAGYRLGPERGKVAFGAGVAPPEIGPVGVRLDYAYSRFDNVFGATHRVTVGIQF